MVNEHGRLLYPRALALLEQATEIEQLLPGRERCHPRVCQQHHGKLYLAEVIARYRRDFLTLPLEMSVGNSQMRLTR